MSPSTSRDPSYRWNVLAIVMIGTLMSALDSSIVNVSIPAIMADFGASVDDIEWVVTGYMLAFAALMPLTAWLRDRTGHRVLYVMSLLVFTGGSVLCGMAWNLPSLVLARVIQAAGGGALTPTGMAMVSEVFPPKERGKALGFWAMGAVMGPAFGPTVGGYLTKYFGWPSIFLVNLPIGLIGIYFALAVLKKDKPPKTQHKPFDTWGFLFLGVFLICFLLGMSKGEVKGWTSEFVVTCGILAALGMIGFLVVENSVTDGIIDLGLLKSPAFAACFILTGIRSLALYGGTFLLPVFLQNFKGLDEVESGLILLPGSLLMGVLMPVAGRMADRFSPRLMALAGFFLLGWFFWDYRLLDLNTSIWGVISPTIVRGFGIAVLIAPLTATAMNAVPTRKAGMASSMLNLNQQVGGSIGIAVLSLVLDHRTSYHLSRVGAAVSAGSDSYKHYLSMNFWHARAMGLDIADSAHAAAGIVGRHIAKVAGVGGFQDAFIVGALISFASILLVFYLPSHPLGGVDSEHMAME